MKRVSIHLQLKISLNKLLGDGNAFGNVFEDIEVRRVLDKGRNKEAEYKDEWVERAPFYSPWWIRTGKNPVVWLIDSWENARTFIIPSILTMPVIAAILYLVWWFSQSADVAEVAPEDLKEYEEDRILEESRFTLRDLLTAWYYWGKDYAYTVCYEYMAPARAIDKQYPAARYTVVLDLESLVHEVYVPGYGIMTQKRPGSDYFLLQLARGPFEVVLYSSRPNPRVIHQRVILDPSNRFFQYGIYREHCRKLGGPRYVKDLRTLGRNFESIIMLEGNKVSYEFPSNVDNAIPLPEWDGESSDGTLLNVLKFFVSLGSKRPADVRPLIKEFKENSLANITQEPKQITFSLL